MTLPEQILCCKAEGKVCRPVVAEHAKLSRQHSAPKIQDTLPVIWTMSLNLAEFLALQICYVLDSKVTLRYLVYVGAGLQFRLWMW